MPRIPNSFRPDPAAAFSALPLFPLPQTVLFPGAVLPLHVFEPRYKALVRDILNTHRMLSVVLITDSSDTDEHGHPRIANVAGAGLIIEHIELPDGRFNILLQGHSRVRLRELPFIAPYRRAEATVLESLPGAVDQRDIAALSALVASLLSLMRKSDASFQVYLPKDAEPETFVNACAQGLIFDPSERQEILEIDDVGARMQRAIQVLSMQRIMLSSVERDLN